MGQRDFSFLEFCINSFIWCISESSTEMEHVSLCFSTTRTREVKLSRCQELHGSTKRSSWWIQNMSASTVGTMCCRSRMHSFQSGAYWRLATIAASPALSWKRTLTRSSRMTSMSLLEFKIGASWLSGLKRMLFQINFFIDKLLAGKSISACEKYKTWLQNLNQPILNFLEFKAYWKNVYCLYLSYIVYENINYLYDLFVSIEYKALT